MVRNWNALPATSCRVLCNLDVSMAGCLHGGDRVVEMARVQEPVGIKLIWLHPENAREKKHVVVGHPHFAGLDFADLSPGGILHSGELQFDRHLAQSNFATSVHDYFSHDPEMKWSKTRSNKKARL